MLKAEIINFVNSLDRSKANAVLVEAETVDKTLTSTNVSFRTNVDPLATQKNLPDVDSRFFSEKKSKSNSEPRKAKTLKHYWSVYFIGGNIDCRALNGTQLEAADAAAARKAEGKEFKSTKEWVEGFGPVKTGTYLPCSDGTPSPIEVTSQVGVLLQDIDNPENLTLVGVAIDGTNKAAKEAGISIPETTYTVTTIDGETSSYNPWDDQYKEFRSYADKTRELATPINILGENIHSLKVVGTRNPDGTISWAK